MQKWEEEAMIRARAHEEGLSEGLSQGRRKVLIEMVRDEELTMDAAAKRAGMSAEEFEKEMSRDWTGESEKINGKTNRK